MGPRLPPQPFSVSPSCHIAPSAPALMPPGSFVALQSCSEEQGFEPNRPPAARLLPVISPPPTTLQPEQPSKNPQGEDVLDFSHPPPLSVPACGLKALPTHWPGQPHTDSSLPSLGSSCPSPSPVSRKCRQRQAPSHGHCPCTKLPCGGVAPLVVQMLPPMVLIAVPMRLPRLLLPVGVRPLPAAEGSQQMRVERRTHVAGTTLTRQGPQRRRQRQPFCVRWVGLTAHRLGHRAREHRRAAWDLQAEALRPPPAAGLQTGLERMGPGVTWAQ